VSENLLKGVLGFDDSGPMHVFGGLERAFEQRIGQIKIQKSKVQAKYDE
jgi:hypothetical protein